MSKNYSQIADGYCDAVLSGDQIACKWVRRACERHRADMGRAKDPAWPYEYDEAKANRFCELAGLFPHCKGVWARAKGAARRIKWEPWQYFILCNLFGWVKKADGYRRFRNASLYIPRKNSKSTTAAVIGWLMFAFDDEPGAEVYSGATSLKQAMEVFAPAREMGRITPDLIAATGTTINVKSLVRMEANAKFEPVIGKPGDGASPHCAICDEMHEHQTSELHDTMITGMGARRQPLLLVISTAGDNLAGPCKEDWDTCQKILDRLAGFVDETHFCIIFTIDAGTDWTTDAALRMANPNYDVSVSGEFLRAQLAVALRDPRAQGTYKTKHLNLWVSVKNTYFNTEEWANCRAKKPVSIDDMAGKDCILAGDFASKRDLTTLVHLFPLENGAFRVFAKHYLPRGTVDLPENQHYRAWEAGGRLTVCEGDVIDYAPIVADAGAACAKFNVTEMPFDPNRAWGVFPQLQAAGVPVIEYRIVVLTMSEPMKFLDALIRSGKIEHDGDPVLAWAISNVVATEDKKENVFPNKPSAEKKIDPAVALIMALGRAMVKVETAQPGILTW
jgi:phage terminase large subunit-like protein